MDRYYTCIDLKSFFASVECVERGLDPFETNLVVADASRGRGGICLAITPAMKALGIRNRCRLYEIPEGVEYITALPRMKKYMQYSALIYSIYLDFISPEDIHVYSVDECFIDLTNYTGLYRKTPKEIAKMLMNAVFERTGICATAGVGTNLFLAKVALDITAKHVSDCIGELDGESFKKELWHHRPITDIWNIGCGTARRLERMGIYDLYGVAHADEKLLYREFGVNARYLIDHSHGLEPCTIRDIQSFRCKRHSLSNSQILFRDYGYDDARTVLKEMVEVMALELVEKNLVTDSISLRICYSKDVAPSTGGSMKLGGYTSSYTGLKEYFDRFYERTTLRDVPIRRLAISMNNVVDDDFRQYDLFMNSDREEREKKLMKAVNIIKYKYGKNSVLRCMSLQQNATARMRNKLVGGHNGE
jgi:DNA polymerase V